MKTALLDIVTWDLVVDAGGNIAVASNPYALAQDSASEIRLYQGELYWDTTRGVPYDDQILGKSPPLSYMKKQFVTAAELTPEVVAARAFIQSFVDRKITGQVQVTDKDGVIAAASF